jgi:hypothetical protein
MFWSRKSKNGFFVVRCVLKILAVLVVGTALGLFATWLTVFRGSPTRVNDGPWKTNLTAGSTRSTPFSRAFVAVHGLFALNRSETIYYTAATDNDGHRLDGHCLYKITGTQPDARWWSITAYGADSYLIPNPANRYSIAKTISAQQVSFTVQVGGRASGTNWIPVGPGRFSLTLRLYNPGPGFLLDPAHAILPAVIRVSCP